MSSAAQFTVHSFQINVDAGDSSIHLLVDESGGNRTVVRSVLIDGGWCRAIDQQVQRTLTGVLAELRDIYEWPAVHDYSDGQPAFDAIVISKLVSCRSPVAAASDCSP